MEQGASLLAGGRFHEALQVYAQALRADADSLAARMGLARAAAGTGDLLTATAWCSDACRVAPEDPAPLRELAELVLAQKSWAQAVVAYRRLHDHFGVRDRVVLLHYGFSSEMLGDIDTARSLYEAAIEAEPQFLEAHVDLAGVLWRMGDYDGALRHAQRAVELNPQHPYAVRILGTALLNLNRLPEAEQALMRALQLQPGMQQAELDMALTLLLAGRYEEGWRWYALRWRDERMRRPDFWRATHEWRGPHEQPLQGRSIAVYAEQGVGDALQFLRFVPLLQQQAARVVAVVAPEMVALVEHSFPGVECLAPGRSLRVDLHAALLDLPLHFGITFDKLPREVPYLRAPAAKQAEWKERLAPWAGRFKVGLAWTGAPHQVNNRNRSIALGEFAPLLDMPGVQCFSLQKDGGGAYTDIAAGERLVDLTPQWKDMTDNAAMVEQLDLVVSIDTSAIHLAGALGRPAWLLPAPNPDWRWLLDREDSPWYPTVRLFRRGLDEPRAAQVARVAAALQQKLLR